MGDGDLVRATLEGDNDAFGRLVGRHLDMVFEAAWRVVHDRWVAADVTGETFEYAWQTLDELPPDHVAEALVDLAERRARYVLDIASGGLDEAPTPEVPESGTLPSVGPVLSARIVSALQAKGVPASVDDTGSHRALHLRGGADEQDGWGLSGNPWLPAAVIAVVVVGLVAAFVAFSMGGGDGDGVGTGETASGALDDTTPSTAARATTSSTAAQTTTSEDTTTTSSSSTTTTEPDATTTAPPQTTTTPPSSPGTTATLEPGGSSSDPVIYNFGGALTGRTCGDGDAEVRLWWDSGNGESARLQPDGSESLSVPLDGSHVDCAEPGTEWTLTIRNGGDTDTQTITVG